jgi:hypothetical protein
MSLDNLADEFADVAGAERIGTIDAGLLQEVRALLKANLGSG